jgi:hypothetical protein
MNYLLDFKNWKNIHESALLNEDDTVPVFETTFLDAKAASKAFAAAFDKKSATATYAGTYHYFYVSKYNPDTEGFNDYDVKIIGFGNRKYKDGYFPDVAAGDEGATAYWSPVKGLISPTNWPDFVNSTTRQFNLVPYDTTTALADVANINKRFNSIPLANLQTMITKYPKISNLMAIIRDSKPDFYKALTGNALALYKAAVKTAPAPAPVKKP